MSNDNNINHINNDTSLRHGGNQSDLPNNGGLSNLTPDATPLTSPQANSPNYLSDNTARVNHGAKSPPQPKRQNFDYSNSAEDEFDFNNANFADELYQDPYNPQGAGKSQNNNQQNTDNNAGAIVHDNQAESELEIRQERKRKTRKVLILIGVFLSLLFGGTAFVANAYLNSMKAQKAQTAAEENVQQEDNSSLNSDNGNATQEQAQNDEFQKALNGATSNQANNNDLVGAGSAALETTPTNAASQVTTAQSPVLSDKAETAIASDAKVNDVVSPKTALDEKTINAPTTAPLIDSKGQPRWDYFFEETGLSDKEKQAAALKERLEAITGKKFALFPNDDVAVSETAKQAASDVKIADVVDVNSADNPNSADEYVKKMQLDKITPPAATQIGNHSAKQKRKNMIAKAPATKKRETLKKSTHSEKNEKETEKTVKRSIPYAAQAVVFGQMWLETPAGTRAFVNGDTLPNGARILDINPNTRIVKTTNGNFKIP